MKTKIFTLGMVMLFSSPLLAQGVKGTKGSIGLTFSAFGNNDVMNAAGSTLICGPGYHGKRFYTLGLSYIYSFSPLIDVETGIEFSSHTITTVVRRKPSKPSSDVTRYDERFSLISIPITARINFLKYFFINGGALLEWQTKASGPIDNQSGLGAIGGIGAKYELNNGLGAFINNYYKFHALLPFSAERDDYRWKIIEGGVRVGITYTF